MEWLKSLVELGKLKGIGITLALIGLIGLFGWTYYKTITNHLHDSTNALIGLSSVVEGNTEVLRAVNQTLLIRQ